MIQRTILYIEDDATARALVKRVLSKAGYKVITAQRALEGLDLARKWMPDLILTDIALPDLNGRELTSNLRADPRFASVPIVALTAESSEEKRELALAAGVNGYLTKPFDAKSLLMHMEFFLSGGTEGIDDSKRLQAARDRHLAEVVSRLEARIRELETSNEALTGLDQMKDTFIQLTAHELRTPLTLIAGYGRLLVDHPPLQGMMAQDQDIGMLIKGLTESINRMQTVIEEILTMSRIMTNQIELTLSPTNLGALVARVLGEYEQVCRERQLSVHFNQHEWPVSMRADTDLLRVVINNLLSNAVKYTPDGGQIKLKARMDGQSVHFIVQDTGMGIDPAEQESIFRRFHTVRDIALHSTSKTAFGGGGLGLGLPICRGIVEAHGGRIWVESKGNDPQQSPGSTFCVVLPLITQPRSKNQSSIKRLVPQQ